MHGANAHLRLHVSFNAGRSIVVKTVHYFRSLRLLHLLDHCDLLRLDIDLWSELVLCLILFSFDPQSLQSLVLLFLNLIDTLMQGCHLIEFVLVDHTRRDIVLLAFDRRILVAICDQIRLEAAFLHH